MCLEPVVCPICCSWNFCFQINKGPNNKDTFESFFVFSNRGSSVGRYDSSARSHTQIVKYGSLVALWSHFWICQPGIMLAMEVGQINNGLSTKSMLTSFLTWIVHSVFLCLNLTKLWLCKVTVLLSKPYFESLTRHCIFITANLTTHCTLLVNLCMCNAKGAPRTVTNQAVVVEELWVRICWTFASRLYKMYIHVHHPITDSLYLTERRVSSERFLRLTCLNVFCDLFFVHPESLSLHTNTHLLRFSLSSLFCRALLISLDVPLINLFHYDPVFHYSLQL